MCTTRAMQQAVTVVARVTRWTNQLGCVCTHQTCGSYFRLENEAAELLMLEGAQRAVASVDVKEWGERYAGPGQCPWPVRGDADEAAMASLGLPPSPRCSVRLICSYEAGTRQ